MVALCFGQSLQYHIPTKQCCNLTLLSVAWPLCSIGKGSGCMGKKDINLKEIKQFCYHSRLFTKVYWCLLLLIVLRTSLKSPNYCCHTLYCLYSLNSGIKLWPVTDDNLQASYQERIRQGTLPHSSPIPPWWWHEPCHQAQLMKRFHFLAD